MKPTMAGKPPGKPLFNIPDHNKAQNTLLQIVTAARNGDFNISNALMIEFTTQYGSIEPLFITAIALIESMITTVAAGLDMPPDTFFAGVCLGLSVKQIEEEYKREGNQHDEE
jgi:hypothetical protein